MKLSTKKAIDKFVLLVGGSSWKKSKSSCRGKWAGTYDHSIIIDERVEIFISNGMSLFESRLLEWCDNIESFNKHKEDYLQKIREQVIIDNEKSIAEGMYPVKVLDIGVISPEISDEFNFFYPYVKIEINGKQYKFTEAGLCSAFFRNEIDKCIQKAQKPIWTAGGVKNPNFIFLGVRFNSEDGMYRIR